jgi:UDP-N-acetylmuramate: L-alanyl-gamma-D-glutamyl-meso-diaminopimelate ligase
MRMHILGICGTFMAGIAALAREAGHAVTGSDANAWPPMSTQLEALGITLMQGYEPSQLKPAPDVVVVGNVITRGNAAMEYVLNEGLPYTSGPQWLAEHVLQGRHVVAVAGTHGKTTTSALLAWLLEHAGLAPGFLVGGVPQNFGISARLGSSKYFVIEADEYDTAFFDKRSKFVHYRPRTAILNNLEYDHADIFPDLAAIERQFHHLVRTVPGRGRLVVNGGDRNLARVIEQGCWSERVSFDDEAGWHAFGEPQAFELRIGGESAGFVHSPLAGRHNQANTLAAFAAAHHVGVPIGTMIEGLAGFTGVKRRLEKIGEARGISVYDDFAHHPTAIATTVDALRRAGAGRVLAVLEPRSNTMRLGTHGDVLAHSLHDADLCFVYARPDLQWNAQAALGSIGPRLRVQADFEALIAAIVAEARPGDRVLVMSNGDFGGIHRKLLERLGA